jgi:3-oxoacyl-[acyl-carrier protein] reductase
MHERRTAIISGGCGGVGRIIGKKLTEDGFDVIALYHTTTQEQADNIAKSFGAGNHEALKCDIRDESAVSALIETVVKKHGAIDACIHAAVDPILWKNTLEMTKGELEGQLETGLLGGFVLLKGVASTMKLWNKGSIVGILSSTVYPNVLSAKMSGYNIGKFALRGLLKELYRELMPSHIRVNAIAPNMMDTKLVGSLPKEVRTFMMERAPGGSVKTPQDVASIVSYLCSKEGDAINGKIFSFEKKEVADL